MLTRDMFLQKSITFLAILFVTFLLQCMSKCIITFAVKQRYLQFGVCLKIRSLTDHKKDKNNYFCLYVFICLASITISDENILCNNNIWSTIKGTWIWSKNSSGSCSVSNSDSGAGNVIWIGSNDGLIPNSTYNNKSFIFEISLSISGNVGGVLFRANTVSATNNGGQQYWYGIGADQNRVYFGKFDDDWTQLYVNYLNQIEYNREYTLKIESFNHNNINNNFGYFYNFYLDNNLIISNIAFNDYIFGSFALRTYNTPTIYNYVSITNNTRMYK